MGRWPGTASGGSVEIGAKIGAKIGAEIGAEIGAKLGSKEGPSTAENTASSGTPEKHSNQKTRRARSETQQNVTTQQTRSMIRRLRVRQGMQLG